MTTVNETWTHANSAGALTADNTWTLISGTEWGIVSNQASNATNDASTAQVARCETSVGGNGQQVTATLTTFTYASALTMFAGVLCRKDSTSTYTCYELIANAGSAVYQLRSTIAGSATTIGSGGIPAVNDVITLRAIGNQIQAIVNNVMIVNVTDATIPTGTFGGVTSFLHGESGDIATLDNWSMVTLGGNVGKFDRGVFRGALRGIH